MRATALRNTRQPVSLARRQTDQAPDLLTRLTRGTWRKLLATPVYHHTLIGRTPVSLSLKLSERWSADEQHGQAILSGDIEFAGETVRHPKPVWRPAGVGDAWLVAWHGFDWLGDLISGGAAARDPARVLIQSWLDENAKWHPVAWRSDVVATRIFAWIVHFDEIAGREADRALSRAMLASLARQVRHLSRAAAWELSGAQRIRALKGLLAGLVALGEAPARVMRALRALETELPAQILPDGGHRTRNPSVQLAVLRDLIDARAVLRAAKIDVPAGLQAAIERMAPMLRFFRHGDRRLALFNDSIEEDAILVDLALTRSEARAPAPPEAPSTGFQRLQCGQSLVVIDSGKPAPQGFDEDAHAGILSFELSQGRERIIVNCGGYRGSQEAWRRVARSTAAHSVLVANDTNAVEIRADGSIGRGPAQVRCERSEQDGHQWIAIGHDGYRQRFGLTYSRELYLAADGEDMRGEEKMAGRAGTAFAIRFHLHPTVQATLLEDNTGALLRLPSGATWHMRAAGADMSLSDSIYLGSGQLRGTHQIVLSGTTVPGGATVRWALRREPSSSSRPAPRDI